MNVQDIAGQRAGRQDHGAPAIALFLELSRRHLELHDPFVIEGEAPRARHGAQARGLPLASSGGLSLRKDR